MQSKTSISILFDMGITGDILHELHNRKSGSSRQITLQTTGKGYHGHSVAMVISIQEFDDYAIMP